jgi:hypothetical protein
MIEFLNGLKGFRTLIVQAVVALVGVLVALNVIPATEALVLTPEYIAEQFNVILGGAIALVSAIAVLMRLITKTPVGKQAPKSGGAG